MGDSDVRRSRFKVPGTHASLRAFKIHYIEAILTLKLPLILYNES
jgi:hypothetical protein